MNAIVPDGLFSFSLRNRTIEHPAYLGAIERIERLHRHSRRTGHAGGLLVTGLSGCGKTTAMQEFASRLPVEDDGEVMRVPILSVDTPAGPTVKNFAEAFLVALGDSASHKGTAEQKTLRIYHLLKICRVQLIMIDEFQHFFVHGRRSEVARVTDWLKSLLNKAGVPVVLFGLPECEFVFKLNVQLARRFSSRYRLRPLMFSTARERFEVRGVLSAVEQSLPLPSLRLEAPEMAERFFHATYGVMDFICKIIDAAVEIAIQRGCQRLDEFIYAEAFTEEVWREAPADLNPFTAPVDKLRPLVKPGEPFAEWEASMTSPKHSVRPRKAA